jgi:hypothetical protein
MSVTHTDYVRQRLLDWEKQHGESVWDGGSMIYYADGARREKDPMGVWVDPDPNPVTRVKQIIQYHKALLTVMVAKFDRQKNMITAYCQSHMTSSPAEMEGPMEELRQLYAKTQAAKAALAKAQAKLAELVPNRDNEFAEWHEKMREKNAKVLTELNAMQI